MFHAPIVQWLSTCSCSVSDDMSLFFLSHKGVVHGTKGSKIRTSTMNSFTPQGALSTNHCAHASKTWLRVGSQQGDMSCGNVNIYHARILRNASLASINERLQHIWLLCLWWLWWPDADTNKCSEFSGCMTVFLNDSVVILGQQWHHWRLWMVAVQREFVQSSNGWQIQSINWHWDPLVSMWSSAKTSHQIMFAVTEQPSDLVVEVLALAKNWFGEATSAFRAVFTIYLCTKYGSLFFLLFCVRHTSNKQDQKFQQEHALVSTQLHWGRRQVSSTKQYLSSTYLYGVPPNIRRAVNSKKKKECSTRYEYKYKYNYKIWGIDRYDRSITLIKNVRPDIIWGFFLIRYPPWASYLAT